MEDDDGHLIKPNGTVDTLEPNRSGGYDANQFAPQLVLNEIVMTDDAEGREDN